MLELIGLVIFFLCGIAIFWADHECCKAKTLGMKKISKGLMDK